MASYAGQVQRDVALRREKNLDVLRLAELHWEQFPASHVIIYMTFFLFHKYRISFVGESNISLLYLILTVHISEQDFFQGYKTRGGDKYKHTTQHSKAKTNMCGRKQGVT